MMASNTFHAFIALILGVLVTLATGDPTSGMVGLILVLISFILLQMRRFRWALLPLSMALGVYTGMLAGL